MSPVVPFTATVVLGVWVGVLTVMVWRRCREPWRDDGRPVYRRLRNGRIQFSWGVAAALGEAQRQYHDHTGEEDVRPVPPGGRPAPPS